MNNRLTQPRRRRRHLPHWEEAGATYFVTFRLRRAPIVDLTSPEIGKLVVGALQHFDGERYSLYDYTVMPDHVHVILKPIMRCGRTERLSRITHSLNGWLAHEINGKYGLSGPLWQDESYDHIIRNADDYREKAAYILDNAWRRGLVSDPERWPWWGKGSGR